MTKTIPTTTTTPKAIFMMGGAGAGKGYVRNRDYAGIPVLDCDAIKEEHPSYDAKRPQDLHEWSRVELTRRYFAALSTGDSFVYDGTGANAEKYAKLITEAREAGFEIVLHFVRCDLATALERNAKRDRTVPEAIVRDRHATIEFSFNLINPFADVVRVTDNGAK